MPLSNLAASRNTLAPEVHAVLTGMPLDSSREWTLRQVLSFANAKINFHTYQLRFISIGQVVIDFPLVNPYAVVIPFLFLGVHIITKYVIAQ